MVFVGAASCECVAFNSGGKCRNNATNERRMCTMTSARGFGGFLSTQGSVKLLCLQEKRARGCLFGDVRVTSLMQRRCFCKTDVSGFSNVSAPSFPVFVFLRVVCFHASRQELWQFNQSDDIAVSRHRRCERVRPLCSRRSPITALSAWARRDVLPSPTHKPGSTEAEITNGNADGKAAQ